MTCWMTWTDCAGVEHTREVEDAGDWSLSWDDLRAVVACGPAPHVHAVHVADCVRWADLTVAKLWDAARCRECFEVSLTEFYASSQKAKLEANERLERLLKRWGPAMRAMAS